jgi:adenosine deaminase
MRKQGVPGSSNKSTKSVRATIGKHDQKFVEGIPKCELHLHIEGSLEPEMMFTLAERNKMTLKYRNVGEVRRAYKFKNLQSFLDVYYAGASVLRSEEDFYDLTYSYFKKAAGQNVRHAEIFFDPQTHTARHIPIGVVIDGISRACDDARRNLGVSSYLILCFLRHLSASDAMDTLKQALPFKEKIIGVGLDSSENGYPAGKFKSVFASARRHGFLSVAHAGEEGPPSYVWGALRELKVRRIDHGVRSLEDPKLVKELAAKRIPLTVCPLSNVKLGVFPNMKSHCLKEMMEKGLRVTINSDDPAYFGGYVNENFTSAQKALHLTRSDIEQLARNSFEASFLPKTKKLAHIREINKFVKQSGLRKS